MAWNAVWNLFSLVFWFHPLAWRIGSAHRAACDDVCDAVSASYLGDVQAYRRTLARVAVSAAAPAATAGLAMARTCDVRRRLAALERKVFSAALRRRTVAGIAVVGLSALGFLAGLRLALAEPAAEAKITPVAAKDATDSQPDSAKKKADSTGNSKANPAKPAKDSAKEMLPGFRPMKIQAFDANGKPLADATATVRYQTETGFGPIRYPTDAEGIAMLEVPREGLKYYSILVWKNGYVTQGAVWDGHNNLVQIPDAFSFNLEAGTIFGGRVEDEQGKPLAGVEVTVDGRRQTPGEIRWVSMYDTVKTDAEGKWQVNRVPKDLSGFETTVMLKYADFGIERFDVKKLSVDELRNQTAKLVMRKGASVEGTVTTPDGKPAVGAAVGLFTESYRNDLPRTKTDEQGRYRFVVHEPGAYTVATAAEGFVPEWKSITVGKERQTLDLKLGKGERIRLRVVDQAGKPVPGVRIGTMFGSEANRNALMLDYESLGKDNPAYFAPTDAEGRWSRLWIPNDEIRFVIEKTGYASVQRAFAPSEREQVITLEAGEWSVSGRVVDEATRSPVKNFRVTEGREIRGRDPVDGNDLLWYQSQPMANENGEYRLTWDRPDGQRVIRVEADGYYASEAAPLGNKKEATANFELKKGEDVAGVIRAPDGKPAANVDVALCTPGRGFSFRDGRVGTDQFPLVHRTGADGRFSFSPQSEPCLIVAANDAGFAWIDDPAAMKEVTLQPWARVEGTVTIDGKPAAKEIVKINYENHWGTPMFQLSSAQQAGRRIFYYFEAQTDADGHFKFERVLPGETQICRAVKLSQQNGMSSWTYVNGKSIEPVSGKTITVNLGGIDQDTIRERANAEEKARPKGGSCVPPLDPEAVKRVQAAMKVLEADPPATEDERIGAATSRFSATATRGWTISSRAPRRSARSSASASRPCRN